MAFVKLDTAILMSSLWIERDMRSLFVTALVMAEPYELIEPMPQLEVRSLEPTGWTVPPGWYGFIRASGTAIVRQDGMRVEDGLTQLERLCAPDLDSRSSDYEGRRMARIDGGYIVLNYFKYRDYDHGAADRMRRLRARRKGDTPAPELPPEPKPEPKPEPRPEPKQEPKQDVEYAAMIELVSGQLAERLGTCWPDVDAFIKRREYRTWKAWMKEMLSILTGGNATPDDLARVCRDDEALTDPVASPRGLRTFITNAIMDRRKAEQPPSLEVHRGTNGNGNGAKPAPASRGMAMYAKIRDLITVTSHPGQAPHRMIPKAKVGQLGADVLKAYESVGGAERFLNTAPNDVSFLIRDFSQALEAQEGQSHGAA